MRRILKTIFDALATVLVWPAAALCAFERRRSGEAMFAFWAQSAALVPGTPGVMLRRAFYRLTVDRAARSFYVGFGAFLTHRHVTIEEDVYVGTYALVGCSTLRRGSMIGSRASVLSGPSLHELDANGQWGPSNMDLARPVEIGETALIGEGAIVMADVGPSALVAAGAVVSTPVPQLVVVAGNPARFVRQLPIFAGRAEQEVNPHGEPVSTVH